MVAVVVVAHKEST